MITVECRFFRKRRHWKYWLIDDKFMVVNFFLVLAPGSAGFGMCGLVHGMKLLSLSDKVQGKMWSSWSNVKFYCQVEEPSRLLGI